MELQQLEKTFKAGIINQKEFDKGKERIESKMKALEKESIKKEEGKKIVSQILDEPKEPEPKTEKPEEKVEEEPKKAKPKPAKKAVKKAPKKEKQDEDDYDEGGAFSKFIIFAGIVAIILLLVLVRIFTGQAPAERDLTNVQGVVDLEVYMDFDCRYAPQTWQTLLDLKQVYGDHLTVSVQHFPMSMESLQTSNAIQCANDQKMHMDYIARLLENMDSHDIESLKKYGWAEGLEPLEFYNCVDEGTHLEKVKSDLSEGLDMGVRESPTFFIDGEMVEGTLSTVSFEERIDQQLGI